MFTRSKGRVPSPVNKETILKALKFQSLSAVLRNVESNNTTEFRDTVNPYDKSTDILSNASISQEVLTPDNIQTAAEFNTDTVQSSIDTNLINTGTVQKPIRTDSDPVKFSFTPISAIMEFMGGSDLDDPLALEQEIEDLQRELEIADNELKSVQEHAFTESCSCRGCNYRRHVYRLMDQIAMKRDALWAVTHKIEKAKRDNSTPRESRAASLPPDGGARDKYKSENDLRKIDMARDFSKPSLSGEKQHNRCEGGSNGPKVEFAQNEYLMNPGNDKYKYEGQEDCPYSKPNPYYHDPRGIRSQGNDSHDRDDTIADLKTLKPLVKGATLQTHDYTLRNIQEMLAEGQDRLRNEMAGSARKAAGDNLRTMERIAGTFADMMTEMKTLSQNKVQQSGKTVNAVSIRPHVPSPQPFSGQADEDFESFQNSLDNYFALAPMSESQKVSFITLLLKGPANKLITQAPPHDRDTCNKIMDLLKANFSPAATQELYLSMLVTRKMKSTESVYDYYTDMLRYFASCNITDSNMKRVFLVQGLLPQLRMQVTVAAPKDIQAAYNMASVLHNQYGQDAKVVAAMEPVRNNVNTQPKHSQVQTAPRQGAAAPARDQNWSRPMNNDNRTCWNCGQRGHGYRNWSANNNINAQFDQRRRAEGNYRPRQNYQPQGTVTRNTYQRFPGFHNVTSPNDGALPYCTSCNTAHPYGSHTNPAAQRNGQSTANVNFMQRHEEANLIDMDLN